MTVRATGIKPAFSDCDRAERANSGASFELRPHGSEPEDSARELHLLSLGEQRGPVGAEDVAPGDGLVELVVYSAM